MYISGGEVQLHVVMSSQKGAAEKNNNGTKVKIYGDALQLGKRKRILL